MLLAFWLWSGAERPAVLVADGGGLVGVLTEQGRALSKPKGAGFVASNWLENDGEPIAQDEAAARWPPDGLAQLPFDTQILHVAGKRALAKFDGCATGQIIVSTGL